MAISARENGIDAIGNRRAGHGRWLYAQIVVAIICGLLVGYYLPQTGATLKPLGDTFIKLIKLVVSPIIFLTISTGIAGSSSLRALGSVAVKAFVYFLAVSTLALAVGMLSAHLLQPGAGMNVSAASLHADAVRDYVSGTHDMSLAGFAEGIVPTSIIGAFTSDNILQVLFVAILFGTGLSLAGERAGPAVKALDAFMAMIFKVVELLMRLAPLAAFGAMAFTVGKYGIGSVVSLGKLVGAFYLSSAVFVLVVLGAVAAVNRFSILRLLGYIKSEIFLVIATSSSESALPSLIEKLDAAGCSRAVAGLVVPLGYSFNLDGTNIYMSLAALFIAQATNTHLSLQQEILLLAVAMVSSKGAAGVSGAGFVTLAATLSIVPTIPVAGIALILGVDRFMSECRAVTNFIGNAVAAVVISRWEKALDVARFRLALASGKAPAADALPTLSTEQEA